MHCAMWPPAARSVLVARQEQTCVYFSVTTGHQQTHVFSEPMFGLVFNAYYALNFVSTDQKQTMTQSITTTFKFYYD
jgi:hypothetical protein